MTVRSRTAMTALVVVFPELAVGLAMWRSWQERVRAEDRERGDAIQWVILTAVGAAIAITVGTIIYTKLQNKANSIDVSTPGANQ
jgi:hypothetical protein